MDFGGRLVAFPPQEFSDAGPKPMNLRRFTVRRLMIVVAIVAFTISTATWARRRWREAEEFYQEKLTYHRSNAAFCRFPLENHPPIWVPAPPPSRADLEWARRGVEYHEAMILKYERAVRYPWLPVSPDPPKPE
jgi:hypothetical protein